MSVGRTIIFFDGPDGCGKTEMARRLSIELGVPYFKVQTERKNWFDGTFNQSLYFDYVLPQFVEQTGVSFVADRGYPAEWVYSRVFGRQTNERMLEEIDRRFAALGAVVVVPVRRSYDANRFDDLVRPEHLVRLHDTYMEFVAWTVCPTITIYVDDLDNDIEMETSSLLDVLRKDLSPRQRHVVDYTWRESMLRKVRF